MLKKLAIFSFAGVIAGCATTYQPTAFSGGFSETQLAENVWRVRFSGNGYTSRERSENMALLRCAHLTLLSGYKYFAITDGKEYVSNSSFTTPTTTTTTANFYGNNLRMNSNTFGGQTIHISKPSNTNTIYMLKEKPENGAFVYDASFICKSIGSRYEVDCTKQYVE